MAFDPTIPADADLDAFLTRIEGRVIPVGVAQSARSFWRAVRAAIPDSPVPIATARTDGPVTYTWRGEGSEVVVELHANGVAEWWLAEREGGGIAVGREGSPESVATSKEFHAVLKSVLRPVASRYPAREPWTRPLTH